jgi:hypothetical protein
VGSEQQVSTVRASRELKRAASASTSLLFLACLLVGILYAGSHRDYWTVAKWTGIGAPVATMVGILCLSSVGWTYDRFAGLGHQSQARIRWPAVLWILLAIELPWIAAWLGADAVGNWYQMWRQQADATAGPAAYLWGVRLLAGLVTYALASAIGVFATILLDMRLSASRNEDLD